jgi:hypothetical protein
MLNFCDHAQPKSKVHFGCRAVIKNQKESDDSSHWMTRAIEKDMFVLPRLPSTFVRVVEEMDKWSFACGGSSYLQLHKCEYLPTR